MPTKPLDKETYLAPLTPIETLKRTGNGIPCFWCGLPIKLTNKYTSKEPIKDPNKTTKKFNS